MHVDPSSRLDLGTDLVCGLDPVALARTRLGFHPEGWQIQALRWGGTRLLLNCHRQAGKSTVAAILALHEAMFRATSLTVLVSPSLRQSTELYRKVVDFMGRMASPPRLTEENRTSCTTELGSRIVSLPSSEPTVRGFSGADLVIEDGSARVHDDLHKAIRPMLATSGGRLILMSTPAGKRGHFWEAWTEDGPEWERIKAKAEDCPRIAKEFLLEERRSMGEAWYRQEYECAFVEAEDAVFSADLLERSLDSGIEPLRLRSRLRFLVGGEG